MKPTDKQRVDNKSGNKRQRQFFGGLQTILKEAGRY